MRENARRPVGDSSRSYLAFERRANADADAGTDPSGGQYINRPGTVRIHAGECKAAGRRFLAELHRHDVTRSALRDRAVLIPNGNQDLTVLHEEPAQELVLAVTSRAGPAGTVVS